MCRNLLKMDSFSIVIIALVFTVLSQLNSYLSDDMKNRICDRFNPYFPQLSTKLREQAKLIEVNNSISAQDNYAQWTKNNRKLDKLKKEINELREKLLQFNKSKINQWNKLTKICITIPFILFKLWKGKQIVYNLPSNKIFPSMINGILHNGFLFVVLGPLNWLRYGTMHSNIQSSLSPEEKSEENILSFGVSLGIWCWALNTVISTVEFIINQLFITQKMAPPPPPKTASSSITSTNNN